MEIERPHKNWLASALHWTVYLAAIAVGAGSGYAFAWGLVNFGGSLIFGQVHSLGEFANMVASRWLEALGMVAYIPSIYLVRFIERRWLPQIVRWRKREH